MVILAGAYYAILPLFRNVMVDEELPSENSGAAPTSGKSAEIKGTVGHPASGQVKIVEADGKKYIRYENLKTINGPDIYVYLAQDLEAKDYVNIGEVRATEGNINYEIPEGVDPSDYKYVMIWCKQFGGVLFNSAEIEQN